MFTIIYNNDGDVINIVAGESNYEYLLELGNKFIYVDELPKYDMYRQVLKVIDGKLVVIDLEITAERERTIRMMEISGEINTLKQKLRDYDYIGIKIATGRATIKEYSKQIEEMKIWANRINELEKEVINYAS